MTHDDLEILARETLYRGFLRVDRLRLRHRRFNGAWSGAFERELLVQPVAVGVLPYDPALDAVVLIEQFRVGAYAAGLPPWQTEVVAGLVDRQGEDLADVARRETREEAGVDIHDLFEIHRYLPSPGGSSELVVAFCGRADLSGAGGVHGLDHENEDIRVRVRPADEATALVAGGGLTSGVATVALQWLALNRDAVRRRWAA